MIGSEIKNNIQANRLILFIVRQILTRNTDLNIEYILEKWEKRKEKGKEIFRDVNILKKRLAGDCDDLATLLATAGKEKNYKFSLIYPISDNGVYHIAYMKNNVIYDKWIYHKKIKIRNVSNLKKYYKNSDKIIIVDISLIKGKLCVNSRYI